MFNIDKKLKGENFVSNNKSKVINIFKGKVSKLSLMLFSILSSLSFSTTKVLAVEKIEGGDVTIETLGTIIKNLATQIQVFGIIVAFIALVVFVIQFIIGDDETKQRRKKTESCC